MNCPLCNHTGSYFYKTEFYKCPQCFGIYRNNINYISEAEEKAHYECHNNDVNDVNYQKFVYPIIDYVVNNFSNHQKGLDFGCGTGSVVIKLLRDKHYTITGYDPFFMPDVTVLNGCYDYIVSSEVIEHFHRPYKEFENLKSMLLPKGSLVCMTHLYHSNINFENWYYKNDPTHVFIYQAKTVEWIAKTFRFKRCEIHERLIVFKS